MVLEALRMRFLASLALIATLSGQPLSPRPQAPLTPQAQAATWINQGIDAYRHGQFEQAADDFQKAAEIDPTNPNAHFYAGLACGMLYVPGSDFPDNIMLFERAKTEFKRTLDLVPNYPAAIGSLAKLLFQQAQGNRDPDDKLRQLDEAHDWYQKLAALDPRNKEAPYTLGAITSMKCHPALAAARTQLGMRPDDPGPLPDAAVRQKLKEKYGPLIEDGIANLEGALRLDPRYDEAMEYMNRLLRDRADLRDSPSQYRQDITEAAQWEQRAMDARKMPPPPRRVQRN